MLELNYPSHWLEEAVDTLEDPWYRFSRVLGLVEQGVGAEKDADWLDLGCHQGQFLNLLRRNNYGGLLCGIDAWDENKKGDDGWEYHRMDLEKDFCVDKKFQIVTALEVLEHVIDTDRFLNQCKAHLYRGGYLVLSTPNINSLRNRIFVPFGVYPVGMEYRNIIHHVRLYNVKALVSQLSDHKLDVIKVVGVGFLPQRMTKNRILRRISEALANTYPQFCGNIISIARWPQSTN